MADTSDQDSKTEEPTEKKIRDALEQGKIPVSRETSIFASMAALLVILAFLIEDGVQRLAVTLKSLLDDPDGFRLSAGADANGLLLVIGLEAMRFMLPIVLVLAVFGLATSLLQNSPRLVLERVRPNFSRLSPVQGWSRIYGSQGRVEFAKALFKMVSVSLIVGVVLESSQAKAFEAIFTDPAAVPEMILAIAMRIVSAICIATIVLVAVDLAWARFSWRRELRMTKQEVKDEHKQAEGDPAIRARLRSLARDRSRQRMIAAASKASLVIANPTHYAIALRYQTNETVYDPEARAERSVRNVREKETSQNADRQTPVTVQQNLPDQQVNGGGTRNSNDEKNRREDVTNFEVSHRTTGDSGFIVPRSAPHRLKPGEGRIERSKK